MASRKVRPNNPGEH
jgi:hypothetical protein